MLVDPSIFDTRKKLEAYAREHACGETPRPGRTKADLARVLGAYDLYVDPDDQSLGRHLLQDGFWESWVTIAVFRLLASGQTVVNVGANFGYYAILAADVVGEAGRVYAFEPQPALARMIGLSGNGFTRLTVVPTAVGDGTIDSVTLMVDKSRLCNSYAVSTERPPLKDMERVVVPVQSLDATGIAKVDFMLIDAEGYEERIWDGAQNLLATSDDIVIAMEFTARCYAHAGAFFDKMERAGFIMHTIDDDGRLSLADKDETCDSPWAMLVLAKMRLA